MRILQQPAFILHRRPYRDSSLLLEAFSRESGRLGLVAHGAASSRSRLKGVLQPFTPLLLSWSGDGDLLYLRDIFGELFERRQAHKCCAIEVDAEEINRLTGWFEYAGNGEVLVADGQDVTECLVGAEEVYR